VEPDGTVRIVEYTSDKHNGFNAIVKKVSVFRLAVSAAIVHLKIKLLIADSLCGLWSIGQSSWLQIRRPGLDSRHYQKKKCSGSGTGCTQPREYKLRSYLIEK
jgi:ribosomal protein L37E